MQGSLDNPPIVIVTPRWKLALYLLGSLVFVAIGIWQVTTETPRWWAWLGIALFGLGVPLFAYQIFVPSWLSIGPDGVTWKNIWRIARFEWWQLQDFRRFFVGPVASQIAFDFRKARGDTPRLGSFGGGWEMSNVKLAELLNAAKARWDAPKGGMS